MAFSQNNAAAQGGLKPEGKYEVIITSIDEKPCKSGSTYLNFRLTVRNDVEGQKYGNSCLFYAIWKKKEPTQADLSVNGYTFGRIMAVGKAAGLPDGKKYKDLAEYCNELIGKCVIAQLVHEIGENDGIEREKVKYLSKTAHPDCKHVFKAAVTSDTVAKPKNEAFAAPAAASAAVVADDDTDDSWPF